MHVPSRQRLALSRAPFVDLDHFAPFRMMLDCTGGIPPHPHPEVPGGSTAKRNENGMATFCTLTMNPAVDAQTSTHKVHSAQKLRCAAPRYYAGGGGINVARALRELGGDVVAVFPAGGRMGEVLDEFLTMEDVPHRCMELRASQAATKTEQPA
jgi:hypothetical protein